MERQQVGFCDVESIVQHHVYSAFGKLLRIEDANGVDVTDAPPVAPYFTYTGREWDAESGLYYYRARYYDSSIGRFLQVDPARGFLSMPSTFVNVYIYGLNNPLTYKDPSGRGPFNTLFATLNSSILTIAAPVLAGITSFNNSQNNGGELWQSIAVGFSSAFFTSLAGAASAAANFYLTPWLADIVTPFSTGLIAFAQNATNQAIMSKGQRVDWRRARNAGLTAAAIQGTANLLSFKTNGTPLGVLIDYVSATGSVACVDDGVAPKTKEQVKADGVTSVNCDYTFGF